MRTDRRKFLRGLMAGGGAAWFSLSAKIEAAPEHFTGWPDRYGMLTDLSLCIGCRKCEEACKEANQLPPITTALEDPSVFEQHRRTDAENYTVVNRVAHPDPDRAPVFVKQQCMHCDEPACAAACLVGALRKSPEGAVLYDAEICLGCRYCMIACPFYVPAYEYFNATSPKVRKCTMCHERVQAGERPACAGICPREALTFGKRSELIALAQDRIRNQPSKYQDHVYGMTEAGGTSWLYISEVPFEALGFPTDLGDAPFPELTRGFLSTVPAVFILWPALLGGFYAFTQVRQSEAEIGGPSPSNPKSVTS